MSEQFKFEDNMNKNENGEFSAIRARIEQNTNKKLSEQYIELWLNESK